MTVLGFLLWAGLAFLLIMVLRCKPPRRRGPPHEP